MRIEENIPLGRYTSLHVGGPARYVCTVTTDEEVLEALHFAHSKNLPFFVLGKGSNTLFADEGYEGVIILMADRRYHIADTRLTAASGIFMRQLVTAALNHSLQGLEELAGIPGTVGGAVRGNAGTWSTEIKDVMEEVEIFRPAAIPGTWEKARLTTADCQFGYRDSIFKRERSWVILRATFLLRQGSKEAGQALVAQDLQQRHSRQPYDAPSAGSIFKNPNKAEGIFSGKLIEACNLKGLRSGGAEVSPKHGNFIVNRAKATATDVLSLIQAIQATVLEQHNIHLEPEIEIVPPPSVSSL